jgi:S1-C subfamily serine protease
MLDRSRGVFLVLLVAGIAAGGCGGQSAEGSESAVPVSARAPVASSGRAARPSPPSRIARRDLMPVLSAGLGAFWSRTEVKPSLASGRFRGWQIVALHWEGTRLADVDLQPGDVVMSVNGQPIERPEQAQACWESLTMARELRVSFERGTVKRQIVYPIDDDPPAPKSAK